MERIEKKTIKAGSHTLVLEIFEIGEDILAVISGGDEHIGSVCLSTPRPSLTGEGTSSTTSVLNVPSHKDEAICRVVSESLSSSFGRIVVSVGGFHSDGLSADEADEIVSSVTEAVKEISGK